MTETLSAEHIIVNLSSQIELQWVAGEEDPDRLIHEVDVSKHATLIGHLNLIHSNIIQVIGNAEHKYLQNTEAELRSGILQQLFSDKTVAIIVTDGISVPEEYIKFANANHVPLLSCFADSNKVIDTARFFLHDIFSDKEIIHGVFLEVLGTGVLITGASSIGKSELALELITRGHRLIADDAPEFTKIGPNLLDGRSPGVLKDFIEVRGLGILNIREMYGDNSLKVNKYLRLVISMQRMNAEAREKLDRLTGARKMRTILGVEIPEIILPVAPGRNLAVLVESAVRNHILLKNGHDASAQLIKIQQQALDNQ